MALFRYGNSNAGGGGGGTPVMQETQLWSNSYPGSAFGNQVINLSSSITNYDYIGIYYRPKANTPSVEYLVMVPTSDFQDMDYASDAVMLMSYYNNYYARAVWYVNNTQIHFSDSLQVSGGGNSNGTSIPTKIVGMNLAVE